MKWMAAALALHGIGCASLPNMDSSMPIEIDHGFFASRYKQAGRPIDPGDMVARLKQEPSAESAASRGEGLRVVSSVMASVAGVLIGWPLGQAIGGERKPIWALAGVGAGVFAVNIPIAIWADSSMDSAVEAYNKTRTFSDDTTTEPEVSTEDTRTPGARAGSTSPSGPPGVFGFAFGASMEASAAACRQGGHTWSEEEGAGRCSGAPAEGLAGAAAQLDFTDGRLTAVELVIRPPDDAQGWASAFRETEAVLVRTHGKSKERTFVVPDDCKAEERFLACVAEGKVTGSASWSLDDGHSVALSIAGSPPPSTIRVRARSGQ
ncbi:uncharacterized protein SOCE26_066570 [Sorangium cellulosum]|uniref:Uncharacterized protein n=2 Tax=Sorangium cellulosum TaxID=56 RepID=A0A2L0F0W8_SORCE|nr:uncharacterized protein SOCE26_066570 [Sorangium cellulosum]